MRKPIIIAVSIILAFFCVMTIYASQGDTNHGSRVMSSMTIHDDDVGLKLESVFHSSRPYYSRKMLPYKVESTLTNRLFKKENYIHKITYDTFSNPVKIEYENIYEEKIRDEIFEYEEEKVAKYPYPDNLLFGFINVSSVSRLRLKKTIDYENDIITFQRTAYKSGMLRYVSEYNEDGMLLHNIKYNYDNLCRLSNIEYFDDSGHKYMYKRFLYGTGLRNKLRYVLVSTDYPYIDTIVQIKSFDDGQVYKERHFKPPHSTKICDFFPGEIDNVKWHKTVLYDYD